MSHQQTTILKKASEAGYTQWPEGKPLNKNLEKLLHAREVGKYGGQYFSNLVFYKGDPDTTTDWLIVFDDGEFYKVGADTMIWRWIEEDQGFGAKARWSTQSLYRGIIEFFETGDISTDPDYQT